MNALTAIKSGIRVATSFVITNKKAILTLAGIGLIGGGAGYMVVQAPKAKDAIITEEHIREKEGKDPLTNIEKVKIGVRYLWVPSAMCTAGTGALLFVNHISVKEVAAAGADALAYKQAYNDLARIHNDYIRGVNKVTTEEQQDQIMDEVHQKRKPQSRVMDVSVEHIGDGNTLYLLEETGQWFESDDSWICNAALDFEEKRANFQLTNSYAGDGVGLLSEFVEDYLMLTSAGLRTEEYGFTPTNPLRIYISKEYDTAPNGRPYKTVSLRNAPILI